MVNLYVRSFEKIDDVKMEFSVQITFRKCFFSLRQFKAKVQTVSTKQSSILMDSDFQRWLSWISIWKLKWENPTFTPRQQWNDNRLAFNSIGGKIRYLTMTEKDKVRGREEVGCSFIPTLPCLQVWMPDTFFRNEKDGKFHDIIQPNLYVRVFPDGDVLYSIRLDIMCRSQVWRRRNKDILQSKSEVVACANLARSVGTHSPVCLEQSLDSPAETWHNNLRVSLTLACPMNLKLFPLDTQTCHLTIASYGWTSRDLQYIWKVRETPFISL